MKLSDTEIDDLLADLGGRDWEKRLKAERFVRDHQAEVYPALLRYYQHYVVPLQTWRKWERRFSYCGMAIIVVGWLAAVIQLPDSRQALIMSLCILGALFAFPYTLKFKRNAKLSLQHSMLIKVLTDCDDSRFVGYLLNLLIENNQSLDATVEPALYRLLPLLKHADAASLNASHRRFLNDRLVFHSTRAFGNFNSEKALSLLKAFEQIGDMRSSLAINEVAMHGGSETVREAAEDCLLYIRMRIEKMEPQKTLLRASEHTGSQDELLRAANVTTDTHAETLLRVPKE